MEAAAAGVPDGFAYWTGRIAENAAFASHRDFVRDVPLPNLRLSQPPIRRAEMSFAVGLILGFAVRLFSLLGIVFALQLWLGLCRHPHEWPWLFMSMAFTLGLFIVHGAGRSLGLDALLRREGAGRPTWTPGGCTRWCREVLRRPPRRDAAPGRAPRRSSAAKRRKVARPSVAVGEEHDGRRRRGARRSRGSTGNGAPCYQLASNPARDADRGPVRRFAVRTRGALRRGRPDVAEADTVQDDAMGGPRPAPRPGRLR